MSTTELISDVIRDIAELEGSDSGPDYMVVTADELRVILERHLAAPSPQQAAVGEARCGHCNYKIDLCICSAAAPAAAVEPTEREKRMQDIGFISPAAAAYPSLYDRTGDIKDINTLLVPRRAIRAGEVQA